MRPCSSPMISWTLRCLFYKMSLVIYWSANCERHQLFLFAPSCFFLETVYTLSSRMMILKFDHISESHGRLIKTQFLNLPLEFLILKSWESVWEFIFLGIFWGMLMLLVQWPHFNNHSTRNQPPAMLKSMGFKTFISASGSKDGNRNQAWLMSLFTSPSHRGWLGVAGEPCQANGHLSSKVLLKR